MFFSIYLDHLLCLISSKSSFKKEVKAEKYFLLFQIRICEEDELKWEFRGTTACQGLTFLVRCHFQFKQMRFSFFKTSKCLDRAYVTKSQLKSEMTIKWEVEKNIWTWTFCTNVSSKIGTKIKLIVYFCLFYANI